SPSRRAPATSRRCVARSGARARSRRRGPTDPAVHGRSRARRMRMTAHEQALELALPRPQADASASGFAARPTTLKGARLGFIWNSKPNGDALFDAFLRGLDDRGLKPDAVQW